MTLIGISGQKRTGKDTIAEFFIQQYPGRCLRIGFADKLYEELAKACGVTVPYIHANKSAFRRLLQAWGTDFRRNLTSKTYWIEPVLRRINGITDQSTIILVPDVRFRNEAETVRAVGGYLLRVTRDTGFVDFHDSEVELTNDNFMYDHVIDNNATVGALNAKLSALIPELGL